MLHYYPRHVSSINMPIFRRKNCIHKASIIFALRKRLHSTLVEKKGYSNLPALQTNLPSSSWAPKMEATGYQK